MRLIVMFDLPVLTSENRRDYRKFRKCLINEGFLMMQYSTYVRVCPTRKTAEFVEKRISAFAPKEGVIQALVVTEAQYQSMNFIIGTPSDDIRNSAERTIVI